MRMSLINVAEYTNFPTRLKQFASKLSQKTQSMLASV
jgi:hypothetical protein